MANSTLALGSSLNLKRINRSVTSLGENVRKAQMSSASISKSLMEGNRDKRKSLSLASTLFRRRREAILRREKEDILEAGSVVGAVRRTGKVVMNSTKGFLGRILDYVGSILVGWAILNLPKIIELASGLIERMQKYFGVLRGFVSGVSDFFLGLPGKIGEIFNGINSFNFGSVKDIFDKTLEKLQDSFQLIRNTINKFINKFNKLKTYKDVLKELDLPENILDIPALEQLKKVLGMEDDTQNQGGANNNQGGANNNQTGSAGQYPDPKSVEMYQIAAALTTEGNSDQGYADMMQVVANRVASPGYGNSYIEVLAAGTAANPQFAGVWKRGAAAFKSIRSLGEASAWSGQKQSTLLEVISLMTDPARQASAASFVGGALEFRGSPATVRSVNSDKDPKNNIQADRNGIIPGTVWRGTDQDNQFIISNPPGAVYVPIRPGGAAPLNLPPKNQKVSFNPATKPNVDRTTTLLASSQEMPTNLLVLKIRERETVNQIVNPQVRQQNLNTYSARVNILEQKQLTSLT